MQEDKKVSIIVPYFNRPEKLIRCIESVKKQTYSNYEIIIVDDCSDTVFPELDCEYKYIRNETNKGPGASRNAGMEVANGDYIAFLDSDDYWDSKFLEITLNTFKENKSVEVAFVYCNTINFDEKENIQKRRRKKLNQQAIMPGILMVGRCWSTSSCLWNFKLIKNERWEHLYNWEDYVFDIRIALKYNHIIPVDLDLVYYDITGNEKLSNQTKNKIIIEKSKALKYIVECIKSSVFFNNELIIRLRNIVLSNCIHTYYHVSNPKENNRRNIKSLKLVSSVFFVFLVKLGLRFNNIYGLKILNFLKKTSK